MNAFELIVEGLFRAQGYWTIIDYKVKLEGNEKKEIQIPSMPRPELDILAYKVQTNELIWIECKSYIDSGGVKLESFVYKDDPGYNRYKVFNFQTYREVISKALIRQTVQDGLTLANPTLKYCLVAGNTRSQQNREAIKKHFESNGWLFFAEDWLNTQLEKYKELPYEDNVAIMMAKLLLKNSLK